MKFDAEGREFAKILKLIVHAIHSNSETSEQYLVTECFFNLFLEQVCPGTLINYIEQFKFKLEKNIGI